MSEVALFTLLVVSMASVEVVAQVVPPPSGKQRPADTGYTVIALDTPAGGTSAALALNDHGHVVGRVTPGNGQPRAALWKDGAAVDLGTLPGHRSSEAVAINNAGDIAGFSCLSEGDCRALVWRGDEVTALETLGGSTAAHGLNQEGQVVGESIVPVPKPLYVERFPHAFLWEHGALTDLGGGFEDPITVARAVNDAGQIVGYSHCGCQATPGPRAFLWDDGTVTYLGTFGGSSARAFDINGRGHVVGEAELLSSRAGRVLTSMQAFLWRDGRLINLGTLGGTDATAGAARGINHAGQGVGWSTTARGINDAGQVVGWSTTAEGDTHAFLWRGGTMYDLNDLVSSAPGWVLQKAYAVNDTGAIAGSGELNGRTRAYLLTPSR